jgi:hypothetical protein
LGLGSAPNLDLVIRSQTDDLDLEPGWRSSAALTPQKPQGRFSWCVACAPCICPVRLRLCDPLLLTFKHDLALELSHRSEHVQHQSARGASRVRGVATEAQDAEADALRLQHMPPG